MANKSFDDKYGSDFQKWTEDFYGATENSKTLASIHGLFVRRPDGELVVDQSANYDVPVDENGFPLRIRGAELTEQQLKDLRWDSVLLDHPYTPPALQGKRFPWAVVMNRRAAVLREGLCYRDEETADYVRQWEERGIGPELYGLLHLSIPAAVKTLRRLSKLSTRESELESRLDEMHLAPGDGGLKGRNLIPEQWEKLPFLLTRLRPCVAVKHIISENG